MNNTEVIQIEIGKWLNLQPDYVPKYYLNLTLPACSLCLRGAKKQKSHPVYGWLPVLYILPFPYLF